MEEFFASGRAADLVIGLMLIEGAALALYRRLTGRGVPMAGLAVTLASGVLLTLALRGALTGAGWPFVALPLAAAFFVHIADLAMRWRP